MWAGAGKAGRRQIFDQTVDGQAVPTSQGPAERGCSDFPALARHMPGHQFQQYPTRQQRIAE
jgi:hypothetical protein